MSEKQKEKDLGRLFSFPDIIRDARRRAGELTRLAESPFLSPEQRQSAKGAGLVAKRQALDAWQRMAEIRATREEMKRSKPKPLASGQ